MTHSSVPQWIILYLMYTNSQIYIIPRLLISQLVGTEPGVICWEHQDQVKLDLIELRVRITIRVMVRVMVMVRVRVRVMTKFLNTYERFFKCRHPHKPDLFFARKATLGFNSCLFVILSAVFTIKNRYAGSQRTRRIAVELASHPLRQPIQPIKGPDWHKQLITQLCAQSYIFLHIVFIVCLFSSCGFVIGHRPEILDSFGHFAPAICCFLSVCLSMLPKCSGPIMWARSRGQANGLNMTVVPHIILWACQQASEHSFCVSLQLEADVTRSDLMCLRVLSAYLFLRDFYHLATPPSPIYIFHTGDFWFEFFTCSDPTNGGPCSCQCVVFGDKDKQSLSSNLIINAPLRALWEGLQRTVITAYPQEIVSLKTASFSINLFQSEMSYRDFGHTHVRRPRIFPVSTLSFVNFAAWYVERSDLGLRGSWLRRETFNSSCICHSTPNLTHLEPSSLFLSFSTLLIFHKSNRIIFYFNECVCTLTVYTHHVV